MKFFWYSIVFTALVLPGLAQVQGEDAYGAIFSFQTGAETPVIEMDRDIGLRVQGSTTPFLRIFADGTVLIHYPVFRKNAGDYELRISEQEVADLLASLSEKGVLSFDEQSVKQEKALQERILQESRAQNGQPVLFERSDETLTIIKITLDSYQAADSSQPVLEFQKRTAWSGIAWDAKQYPGLKAVQDLAMAVDVLDALANHPNLMKKQ